MKSLILALSVAVFAAGLAPSVSEAKRLGGGGSSGMQRARRRAARPMQRRPSPRKPLLQLRRHRQLQQHLNARGWARSPVWLRDSESRR